MDTSALRWVLAVIGILLLVGIYLFSLYQSRLRKRAVAESFSQDEADSAFIEDRELREELDNLNQIMSQNDSDESFDHIAINPAIEADVGEVELFGTGEVTDAELFAETGSVADPLIEDGAEAVVPDVPPDAAGDILGDMPGDSDSKLISYLLKRDDNSLINGEEIENAMIHSEFEINDEGDLEYCRHGKLGFTIANLSAPGHFSDTGQAEFRATGLICFINLETNHDPEKSYEWMLQKIDQLVRLLNVKVYRSDNALLTIDDVSQAREKLKG